MDICLKFFSPQARDVTSFSRACFSPRGFSANWMPWFFMCSQMQQFKRDQCIKNALPMNMLKESFPPFGKKLFSNQITNALGQMSSWSEKLHTVFFCQESRSSWHLTFTLQNPLPSLIYKHLKDKEPGLCCYCLISSVENGVNLTPRFIVNYHYQSI